jgi:hypothetical protein
VAAAAGDGQRDEEEQKEQPCLAEHRITSRPGVRARRELGLARACADRLGRGRSGNPVRMATRTPLRDHEPSPTAHPHGLLGRAEEWVEETGFAPEDDPAEGVPWHAVLLLVAGVALLIAVEITLAFGVAKLVTGHAY